MSDFTYEVPNEDNFLKAVLMNLKQKGREDIVSLLEGSKCVIVNAGHFSRKRWNGMWTTVHFSIPFDKYEYVLKHMTQEINEAIRTVCDEVMPPKSGLDVMGIKFSLSLEDVPRKKDLMEDLKRITNELPPELRSEIVPDDIKEKAKQMAETYTYLYCVENALRLFIERVAKENYGEDYFSKLKTNRTIREKLLERKEEEKKNKWLPFRGDSELFYLDFDDLGSLIRNNWELFEKYFPNQEWIVTKIDELSKCRNLVAHNSYVGKEERDLLRVYFTNILKQISSAT